jgi:hypothetical protein
MGCHKLLTDSPDPPRKTHHRRKDVGRLQSQNVVIFQGLAVSWFLSFPDRHSVFILNALCSVLRTFPGLANPVVSRFRPQMATELSASQESMDFESSPTPSEVLAMFSWEDIGDSLTTGHQQGAVNPDAVSAILMLRKCFDYQHISSSARRRPNGIEFR